MRRYAIVSLVFHLLLLTAVTAFAQDSRWTNEQWHQAIVQKAANRPITFGLMDELRPFLNRGGADWQNGWRGDFRPRLFLPVPGCRATVFDPNPIDPDCVYGRTIDIGSENARCCEWIARTSYDLPLTVPGFGEPLPSTPNPPGPVTTPNVPPADTGDLNIVADLLADQEKKLDEQGKKIDALTEEVKATHKSLEEHREEARKTRNFFQTWILERLGPAVGGALAAWLSK